MAEQPASRPAMKLKLSTKGQAPANPPEPSQTPSAVPKIKLKFGGAQSPPADTSLAQVAPSEPPKKEKRKYTKKAKPAEDGATPKTSKKRARAEKDEGSTPVKRQAKGSKKSAQNGSRATADSPAQPPALKIKTEHKSSLPKLKLKSAVAHTPRIKVKHHGLPPPRPPGVGYDSEAEDVEVDPSIEHQFVLRMQPGDDCDYLHKAVEEKRVGVPKKDGGADVFMRFFDREGRRAMVTIRGRNYAATLVDLPCIVEGAKSWDRRGWWKSADICQMLLVLGQVPNEEAAKAAALPREVDQSTWQYAHGLTPPMRWVRKRRFRKRVSYRTIEAVEEEVERLLAEDEEARETGGTTDFKVVDLNRLRDDSEDPADPDGEMFEENGEPVGDAYYEGEDEDEMARLMEAELGGGDDDEAPEASSSIAEQTQNAGAAPSQPTAGATPSSAAVETEETSDDEEEDEEDVDEDTLRAQQENQQIREEVSDLQNEIQRLKEQLTALTNPLLKQRLNARIASMQGDLDLKIASLGTDWEG